MAIKKRGSLRETSTAELLALLYRDRAYGELLCKQGRHEKIVFFKDGSPIFVKSNASAEFLGQILLQKNMITEEDFLRSREEMKSKGRLQGSVLMEMGCITTRHLRCALHCQLKERLLDLCGWDDGQYVFRSRRTFPPVVVALNRTTPAIIYEGIKKKARAEALERRLEPYLDHYVHLNMDRMYCFTDLDFTEDEKKLLVQLRGDSTLRQVMKLGPGAEATMRLIYALRCAGIVRLDPTPAR